MPNMSTPAAKSPSISAKENGDWKVVRGTLKANNRSQQPLHLLLVHFSEDYGFQLLYNERVEPTESDFTVTLDGNAIFNLALDENEGDEAIHTFKLIVSTEKVDDFLLGQEPLETRRDFRPAGDEVRKGLTFGPPREETRPRERMVHQGSARQARPAA